MEIVAGFQKSKMHFLHIAFIVQLFTQFITFPVSRENSNPFAAVGWVVNVNSFVVKAIPGGVFSGYFDGLVNAVAQVFEGWGGLQGLH
jgi:hypothetical protein